MKGVIFTFAFIIISLIEINAQEMFVASGSLGESGKASLCYVIGGIVVEDAAPLAPIVQSKLKKYSMATDLDQAKDDLTLNVYPNPAADFVNIGLGSEFSGRGTVSIYDMSSHLIKTEDILRNNAQMDVSNLIAGIYIVKVDDSMGNYSAIKRIIKN